jgi:hypothetical protein
MKFMMLMIPAVYQGGKRPAPDFVPDPKKIEQMDLKGGGGIII